MPLVLNWQTFCRQTSSVQVRVNSCQIACTSIKYDSTSVHLFLCDQINCIFFIIHVYFQQFSKFIVILLFFRCQLINQGVFFWPSTCLRASPTKAPSALQERVSDPKKRQNKGFNSTNSTINSLRHCYYWNFIPKHIFFQEDQSIDIPRQCENLYYMYIYDNAQK